MSTNLSRTRARRGMTLAELLVVVMIMVILLGIALPLMKPALADRKIREASRQLNAFIRTAQSRAAAANAPVGVWFARTDDVDPNISYQVYYAETPPPYVGETADAALTYLDMPDPNDPSTWTFMDQVTVLSGPYRNEVLQVVPWVASRPPAWLIRAKLSGALSLHVQHSDTTATKVEPLVKRGDTIRFNYSGPDYVIYDIYTDISPLTSNNPGSPSAGDLYDGLKPRPGEIIFGPPLTDIHAPKVPPDVRNPHTSVNTGPLFPGSRFQIFRQPRRTTAGSLSLPNTTAVVLSLSGMEGILLRDSSGTVIEDRNEFHTSDTSPVVIMFRPDGTVDRVYYGNNEGVIPDSPIHLLVGSSLLDERRELPPSMPAGADPLAWQNLNDLNNVWVTIGHRSGAITTTPLQDWNVLYDSTNPNRDTLVQKTRDARALARTVQSVGGN